MNKEVFSRTENSRDDWETPKGFFDLLDKEFRFTLDPCADAFNKKCGNFYSTLMNGLTRNWQWQTVFVNPPFSNIKEWVRKCYEEGRKERTIVVLILPSRTDTIYWHKYIMKSYEIRFCKGRVNFLQNGKLPKHGSTFPLSIVVFKRHKREYPQISSFNHKIKSQKLTDFIKR